MRIMPKKDDETFYVVKPEKLIAVLVEINEVLKRISEMIKEYIREGELHFFFRCPPFFMILNPDIPRITSRERSDASQIIQNTGLIAAFFSGITVTMMQFTLDSVDATEPVGVAVNIFMFSSLVFSISSIINSILLSLWLKSKQ